MWVEMVGVDAGDSSSISIVTRYFILHLHFNLISCKLLEISCAIANTENAAVSRLQNFLVVGLPGRVDYTQKYQI